MGCMMKLWTMTPINEATAMGGFIFVNSPVRMPSRMIRERRAKLSAKYLSHIQVTLPPLAANSMAMILRSSSFPFWNLMKLSTYRSILRRTVVREANMGSFQMSVIAEKESLRTDR